MRGGTKRGGLPGSMVVERLLGEGVEPAGLFVTFDLAVPRCPVELLEPRTKQRKILRMECLNLLLNILDVTHEYFL